MNQLVFDPRYLQDDVKQHLNKKFRTIDQLQIFLAAFSIPRGFKLHIVQEPAVSMRTDRTMLLELACDEPGCDFKLYFGKNMSTFNFILECSEFVPHSHELLIN